jgi:hypothetical protein
MSTGIGHDADGNVDDQRVAGFVFLIAAVGVVIASVIPNLTVDSELVWPLVVGAVGCLAPTVAEKIKRP